MENEPVLGEIRKGKDIGKTHGIILEVVQWMLHLL
jgi:hypothetical protein